jgi:hypothetical protein
MQAHFKHLHSMSFPMIWRAFQSNDFRPLKSLSKNLEIHLNSNSQSEGSLRNVEVHSLTLSHTPGSMKSDSWASFLACIFKNPCLRHEPKVKVVISIMLKISSRKYFTRFD